MAVPSCVLRHVIQQATAVLDPQGMRLPHPEVSACACPSQDASCLSAATGKGHSWGLLCALRGTGLTLEGGGHRSSHALQTTPHACCGNLINEGD